MGSLVLPGVAALTLFLIPFIDREPMIRLGKRTFAILCCSRRDCLDWPDHRRYRNACHHIDGVGATLGPALDGVGQRHDRAWRRTFRGPRWRYAGQHYDRRTSSRPWMWTRSANTSCSCLNGHKLLARPITAARMGTAFYSLVLMVWPSRTNAASRDWAAPDNVNLTA